MPQTTAQFYLEVIFQCQKASKTQRPSIVMPCNSLHIFINQLRHSVKIPVLSIVDGEHLDDDRLYLESVAKRLGDLGVDSIALACTDLQLLLPIKSNVPVFDTMKILAESTARAIMTGSYPHEHSAGTIVLCRKSVTMINNN